MGRVDPNIMLKTALSWCNYDQPMMKLSIVFLTALGTDFFRSSARHLGLSWGYYFHAFLGSSKLTSF